MYQKCVRKFLEMKFPKIKMERKNGTLSACHIKCSTRQSTIQSSCPICMDYFVKGPLERDISSWNGGHCFHTKCIHSTGSSRCPVCRKVTVFTPLFLAL